MPRLPHQLLLQSSGTRCLERKQPGRWTRQADQTEATGPKTLTDLGPRGPGPPDTRCRVKEEPGRESAPALRGNQAGAASRTSASVTCSERGQLLIPFCFSQVICGDERCSERLDREPGVLLFKDFTFGPWRPPAAILLFSSSWEQTPWLGLWTLFSVWVVPLVSDSPPGWLITSKETRVCRPSQR